MLLSAAGVDQLRTALTNAGYTSSGIAGRLGPQATSGMARNDFRAALRATADRDPLGTLIRLFVCAQTEPEPAVAAALAPLPLADALAAGLVERSGDGLRQGIDLEPYGDAWWVALRRAGECPAGPTTRRRSRARHRRGVHHAGRCHRPAAGRHRPRPRHRLRRAGAAPEHPRRAA